MKLVITAKSEINSPKKGEFVALSYLDPKSGKAGEIFTTKARYQELKFDESKICSKDTVKRMVEVADVVDASFGPDGRIESIE